MAELKPCPFCGGEAHVIRQECDNGFISFWVSHENLRCPMKEIKTSLSDSREGAIKLWNRRAADGKRS